MREKVKLTRDDFKRDEQGRTILGSAREMAEWVKLGFEEQDKRKSIDHPFWKHYIDLSKCVLYISYPIGSENPTSQIFNLCDMAGIVPGIEKLEGNPNYLFEVKLDIHLEDSFLYGNFFHYVKFDGVVRMDNAEVRSTFSCFRCLFNEYVFMQNIHLNGGFTYDQCDFHKGLVMHDAVVSGLNTEFSNCIFRKCGLILSGAWFTKQEHSYAIIIRNSVVDGLSISKIKTGRIPVYVHDTTINGMEMDNLQLDSEIDFVSCSINGFVTSVIDKDGVNNVIKELCLHKCNVNAQFHIEKTNIENFTFNFGKIETSGRLRMSQCKIGGFVLGSSSIFGQLDIVDSKIAKMDMEESCVRGYLNFQGNEVKEYKDRQTLCLLKNESLKVNDQVSAMHLYAKEMQLLLRDKSVSWDDKMSLRLSKWFSNFGENWVRALVVTLLLSVVATLLMMGFGSGKYIYDPQGEFIGIEAFVTCLLDSINVFSIPLFSDTIKEYQLNVLGQLLYFIIKLVVAYGSYQFVIAFRKHGRK